MHFINTIMGRRKEGGIVFSLVTVSVVQSDWRLVWSVLVVCGDEDGDSAECDYPISSEGLRCHDLKQCGVVE